MMESQRIKLRQVVLVEGRYDKIKLESLLDAIIIKTDGFSIYRDKQKQAYIRKMGALYGALIATDPDAAGFQIRAFLNSLLAGCEVYHLYLPDLYGKEKRKAAPSKEGKLGVEGVPLPVLEEALSRSGIKEGKPHDAGMSKSDLFELGLTGGENSKELRRKLCGVLGLPGRIGTNVLLAVLNRLMNKNELAHYVQMCRQGE